MEYFRVNFIKFCLILKKNNNFKYMFKYILYNIIYISKGDQKIINNNQKYMRKSR